jgi:hypothetical protein
MGMDVYGKAPSAKQGEYFRNNIWWWRPLWDYCHAIAPDLIDEKLYRSGHYNSGAGLDADGAVALASKLDAEITSGRTKIYASDYQAHHDGTPDEDCDLCNGTGVRRDTVGVTNGLVSRVIEKDDHPRHGQTGWCNGCDGLGHKRPNSAWHHFDVKNVEEFAAFIRASGGFEIN